MNKRSFANLMSIEKKAFEKSVEKFEKLNQRCKELTSTKREAAKDDGVVVSKKRASTPELFVEMDTKDSELLEIQNEDSELFAEIIEVDTDTTMDNPTAYADVITLLKRILDKQDRLEARMMKLETTITDLAAATAQNKRSKAEDMARDKVMRECKVLTQKVHKSICRLTGEDQSDAQIDIAAMLPISTLEEAQDIEEKMKDNEYHQAVKLHMIKLKASGANFEGILQSIYSDEFIAICNWEGRNGKHALMQFSIAAELLYDGFGFVNRSEFDTCMRQCIAKSHNRLKQRRFYKKNKTETKSSDPEMILS